MKRNLLMILVGMLGIVSGCALGVAEYAGFTSGSILLINVAASLILVAGSAMVAFGVKKRD